MAGISRIHVEGVMDEDILKFKAKMEQEVPRFVVGTSRFAQGQETERTRLIDDAKALFALARANNVKVKMTIVGHTDDTGTVEFNDRLSLERAQSVKTLLVDAGIDGATLETIGVGSREPLRVGAATPGFELNRSVTFRVAVNEAKAPTSQDKRARSCCRKESQCLARLLLAKRALSNGSSKATTAPGIKQQLASSSTGRW
jgi:hypothetical protein